MAAYDHNRKAGNQGDIVKHVALIASLNAVCQSRGAGPFRFADLFAGYALNPICDGNEWTQGIGRIHPRVSEVKNGDVQCYFRWYLSRPAITGGMYPGSALIALDALVSNGMEPGLSLYDISAKAVESLRLAFSGPEQRVFHRPATVGEAEINLADFLFIDPPGLYSPKRPDYPHLSDLLDFTDSAARQHSLIWLPVPGSSDGAAGSFDTDSTIKQLRATGHAVTRVCWADRGRTIGCILAARLPQAAITRQRAAIEAMVTIADWQPENRETICHFEPLQAADSAIIQ